MNKSIELSELCFHLGSGCGSVGRVVASNTRGPRFESSNRQDFIMNIFTVNCWKVEKKRKKRPGMAQWKNKRKCESRGFSSSRWCNRFGSKWNLNFYLGKKSLFMFRGHSLVDTKSSWSSSSSTTSTSSDYIVNVLYSVVVTTSPTTFNVKKSPTSSTSPLMEMTAASSTR